MKTFAKAAIVAFGVTGAFAAAPASAQPYDPYAYGDPGYEGDYYDQGYDPAYDQYAEYDAYGEYGDDAYGYCDEYGCPEDYYDLPIYDGEVYYNGLWLTGPLYYRDWGGGRQFWIHGGWRSSQYRGGNFRRALGRSWYRQNRAFRSGFNNRSAYRGNNSYRQRSYGQRSYGQQRNYSGRSSFSSGGSTQRFRGNNDMRSQWSNRQGFGQSSSVRSAGGVSATSARRRPHPSSPAAVAGVSAKRHVSRPHPRPRPHPQVDATGAIAAAVVTATAAGAGGATATRL